MRHKKLKLTVVIFLGLLLTGLQAQNALYIKEKSGVQTSFILNSLRTLTFPAGNMTINKADGSTNTFALSTIRSLNFGNVLLNIPPIGKKESSNLMLYPNPVMDQLQISYEILKEGNVQVEIIDLQGRILHRQTISSQNGPNQAIIPVTHLRGGLYIFRLKNGTNVETIKFLKN